LLIFSPAFCPKSEEQTRTSLFVFEAAGEAIVGP
jgi:hypothetical protein